jgi:hypothetical protein
MITYGFWLEADFMGDPVKLVWGVAPDNLNYQAPAGYSDDPARLPPTSFAGLPVRSATKVSRFVDSVKLLPLLGIVLQA